MPSRPRCALARIMASRARFSAAAPPRAPPSVINRASLTGGGAKAGGWGNRVLSSRRLRFAVDTGGTFTDLVVAEPDGGSACTRAATIPPIRLQGSSTRSPRRPTPAARRSAAYLARGEILVHGTTHAINAIVTGSTARTAFLTTQGHPDTLVFREGGRAEAFDFTTPYPEPYVPKALTFEIPERIMVGRLGQDAARRGGHGRHPRAAGGAAGRGDRGLLPLVDRQPRARAPSAG